MSSRTESKVEQVARALNPRAWWWGKYPDDLEALAWGCRQTALLQARDAVAVPRQPSEAMISALSSYAQCAGYIEAMLTRYMLADHEASDTGKPTWRTPPDGSG